MLELGVRGCWERLFQLDGIPVTIEEVNGSWASRSVTVRRIVRVAVSCLELWRWSEVQ